MKKKEKNIMDEVLDYANKNKGLLFIVGNPLKDEMIVAFNGETSYVKFPTTDDISRNILVGVLSQSAFKESMNEILLGISKTLEVDDKAGNDLYQVVAGSLQAMVKE
jgi:hypothetical protein